MASEPAKRLKRKAEEVRRPSKKKRSSEPAAPPSDGSPSSPPPEEQILLLEASILESKKNYNNIPTLFSFANQTPTTQTTVLAAVALARVFIRLLAAESLIAKPTLSEKETVVVHWLKERLAELKSGLVRLIGSSDGEEEDEEEEGEDDGGVATTAVTLAMRVLKAEGMHLYDHGEYIFPRAFMKDIMRAVLEAEDDSVRDLFINEYLDKFVDVRFFAMQALRDILKEQDTSVNDQALLFNNAFSVLSALTPPPSAPSKDTLIPSPKKKTHAVRSDTQQKKQVQDAWLALMALGLTPEQRKRILKIAVAAITPWFNQPELLADFLTDSYNAGGATSLLALSGVYYLVTKRNLDYPSFYTKLYALLDASILHSRHRARFFRLLDLCLSSTHIPAALVASFIKRLARLALFAPPSAIVFVVPWIYNLFQRHPQTTFMMHREMPMRDPETEKVIEAEGFADPFNMDESDPMETHAIDSCVWELVQLQSHYHPNVATIAKIVSEQFTRPTYNVEDFLDHSYASLLEAETVKEVKKAPVVEFQIPKRIFLSNEPGTMEDGPLVKLWDFS